MSTRRRPRRRLGGGEVLVLIVGLVSVVVYVVVSGVVNAQAPTPTNPGWITLLQPADEPWPAEIQLAAEAQAPGAPGSHPALTYSVISCGDHPFHGVLLIGGSARLWDITVVDQHGIANTGTAPAEAPRVDTVPDLVLGQDTAVWPLGRVQEIPIAINDPTPCTSKTGAAQPITSGTGYLIGGLAEAPVQRTATFASIIGPRASQVWPLVGGLPTSPPNDLGVFQGLRGLPGAWMESPTLHKQIIGGSLTARASVDVAVPPLSDTSSITWDSALPLRATVRITNVDVMDAWQQGLVVAGVGLGIGGSLLASLLMESIRPQRSRRDPPALTSPASTPAPLQPIPQAPSQAAPSPTVLAITGAALIGYLLGRLRR